MADLADLSLVEAADAVRNGAATSLGLLRPAGPIWSAPTRN